MSRYFVSVPVGASWHGYVEADSADEAVEKFEAGHICYRCSRELDVSDDADWDNVYVDEADPEVSH